MENEKAIVTGRQLDLDIAKGIGIILVVWAHASGPLSGYINQFHMPFFFFISGMLFRVPQDAKQYIVRKVNTLLKPFWIWNLLLLPFFFFLYYWKQWDFGVFIKLCVEIVTTVGKVPMLGATWFLPALFWISIIYMLLSKKCDFKYGDILLLIIGIISCVVGMSYRFPYRISRVFVCALFYDLGYLFHKHIRGKYLNDLNRKVLTVISVILFIFLFNMNEVSLGDNYFKYKLGFIIGALAAIYFFLRIAEMLEKYKNHVSTLLIYLGQNSLCIVVWQFVAFRIAILIQIITKRATFRDIFAFPTFEVVGGVVADLYGYRNLWIIGNR